MDEGSAALFGAIIGGILSLLATAGVAWFQARREEERLARERLRENLYALQDAIDPVYRCYSAALEAKWVLGRIDPLPDPELATAVRRLNLLSVRIGDDILGNRLGEMLETLAQARRAATRDAAFAAYNDAQDLLRPIQMRVGELLHTGATVDHGI